MSRGLGIPVKLLHEAEGHTVTIELKTGQLYRGRLDEAEDNMNCQLSDLTTTDRDGRQHRLQQAFIRGSQIRFVIVPDMLRNSPLFHKIQVAKKKADKAHNNRQKRGKK